MIKAHHKALELIQNKEWDAAHILVQNHSDSLSCQIHGYLHRIEGDLPNAQYWYRRGGLELLDNSLEQEFIRLLNQLTDSHD